MRSRRWLAVVFAALICAGCPDPQPPSPVDAGTPVAVIDAGPPPVVDLAVAVMGEAPDGGVTFDLPLSDGARPEVPQLQKLTVTTNLGLRDFRVRIFDEADKVMVSDDTSEALPDAGVRYQAVFPTPLKIGYRYTLVLDAQTGPLMQDATGREHADVRREFKIAGEREKPAPPKKKKKRRR